MVVIIPNSSWRCAGGGEERQHARGQDQPSHLPTHPPGLRRAPQSNSPHSPIAGLCLVKPGQGGRQRLGETEERQGRPTSYRSQEGRAGVTRGLFSALCTMYALPPGKAVCHTHKSGWVPGCHPRSTRSAQFALHPRAPVPGERCKAMSVSAFAVPVRCKTCSRPCSPCLSCRSASLVSFDRVPHRSPPQSRDGPCGRSFRGCGRAADR